MSISPLGTRLQQGFLPEDLDSEELAKFNELEKIGALEKSDGLIRLRSLFRVGKLYISSNNTGYAETANSYEKDFLIEPENLNGARHGDEVLIKRILARRGRMSAKVVMVLRRASINLIGFTKRDENGNFSILNIKNGLPLQAEMPGMDLKAFKNGTVFLIDMETMKVREVLGHLGDARIDERISLLLYGRKGEQFPDDCVEQAVSIPSDVQADEITDRTDLRSLPFCTIDPVTAKDFDDAVYFDTESCTLYVAIADVSHYVPFSSPVDLEAKQRGFTTYLPHKAFPMLPRELSENICSLKPNVDRLAFVSQITLDHDTLEPVSEKFYEAVIHSKRRFNYDEVDNYLKNTKQKTAEHESEIISWLLPLYELTKRLRKKRLKKGFDFRSEEIKITIDSNHELLSTQIETGTPSHSLIEECMLLANKAAVRKFDDDGGAIFRVHEAPEPSSIEKLTEELATIGIFIEYDDDNRISDTIRMIQKEASRAELAAEVDNLIIKSLKRASYSSVNIGHFGLGFEKYGHFTSPIRRYSDLLLHRLIKAELGNEKKNREFLLRNIEPLCIMVSELERNATKAEWDFRDRKFARWASDRLGKRFAAEIVEIDPNGTGAAKAVLIDNEIQGVQVFLKSGNAMLFDKITVEITESDIALANIMAVQIGEEEGV